MFTGIIEELGEVTRVEPNADVVRLTVRGPKVVEGVRHGDSIAVSGVCLTVVESDAMSFSADVMAQTLRMSTLDTVAAGRPVNLERAALVGDRLGGHIVQGHVDGTAEVLEVRPGDEWRVIRFALPDALASLVVDKGSIAVDGVSLTVSALGDEADGSWFEVSLIPETLAATTLGRLEPGDRVNLETDVLARHVQRMLRLDGHRSLPSSLAEPVGGAR
ncbi:riboflavin synthase [Agromyces flavus]|uniref:Riboflavin synthase n=1 Tax=Agromyces flavus TaxID=589382 RepID=A0A1H1UTH5_9MICO|nr:riboflavin synthase [Agromyces flavus]MCP2368150.1 riboflavin synthase [Agromyces flavus]GGI47610.1 riboflavin synthase subunit alpha [Agromyces flavus]SDS75571.1 riboflavin synthase alpha chain [Agromyces flavus]